MDKAIAAEIDRRNARASALAIADAEQLPMETTSLVQYSSRGRVAVIGGELAQQFALRLSGNLTALVILTDGAEEPGVTTIPAGNRRIGIEGYLGNFKITLGNEGRPNFETVTADVILDLNQSPLVKVPIKPPGYLTSITEEPYLTQIEEALKELTGTFEKPKYFAYDPAICAHGRSGIRGCSNCIDACPAEAITSLLESVEVDPHLCQGGGICASVCPTGAIRYVYPNSVDTLHTVRTLLSTYQQAGGRNPVIAFIASDDVELLTNRPDNLLPVVVEELASAGLELWLSALAYGAKSVLLIEAGPLPGRVAEFLHRQLDTTHSLLHGLGYSPDAVRALDLESIYSLSLSEPVFDLATAATYAGSLEKRRTALHAIDHLYQQSTTAQAIIALPDQSPFGRIEVDENACTLCMACTSVCPSKALSAGNDLPKLEFHEMNCVQCGICASACPENAITLQPRLLADAEQRRRMVILHEETPFCCIRCGKAFATKSLIDNMASRLAGHYMFQSERARQRLMMCQDCRVVDVVQDEDAMRTV